MKVYIGPYHYRWISRIHDRWMNRKYAETWYEMDEDDYVGMDKFIYKLDRGLQTIYNKTINKYLDNAKRKVKIHVDGYDVWGADHTIAILIHPILLKLKKNKHGAPYVDDEDVPEDLRSTAAKAKEHEWDTDDNHFKRWDWVLDEMIWAFEQCAKEDTGDDQFYSGEMDWQFVKEEDGKLVRMEYGPNHTFKIDEEGKKAHYDRIKNGHRLFAKYYFSLWD
jgi:hypothetical protein